MLHDDCCLSWNINIANDWPLNVSVWNYCWASVTAMVLLAFLQFLPQRVTFKSVNDNRKNEVGVWIGVVSHVCRSCFPLKLNFHHYLLTNCHNQQLNSRRSVLQTCGHWSILFEQISKIIVKKILTLKHVMGPYDECITQKVIHVLNWWRWAFCG